MTHQVDCFGQGNTRTVITKPALTGTETRTRTHTRQTCGAKPMGLPIPVVNPKCYLYMAANTKDINDEAKKISFVLSYMKAGTNLKMAESWKNRFVEKYLLPAQPQTLPSYSGFINLLDAEFKDSNVKAKAFAALHSLKQTGSVDEYTAVFRNLVAKAGITQDGPMIDYYRMGLRAPVVD
jgi:Retrotransposon gag protein